MTVNARIFQSGASRTFKSLIRQTSHSASFTMLPHQLQHSATATDLDVVAVGADQQDR
jgi:hypothetical protein